MATPPTAPPPGPIEQLEVAPPPLAEQGQPRWLVPARLAGLLAALVLVGFGAVSVMAQFITTRTSGELVRYGPDVVRLAVTTHSGDVTVRLGTGDRITVRTVRRFAFGDPVVRTTVRDGTLQLDQSCPRTRWFLPNNCKVDFEVTAPPSVALRVTARTGDVRVQGASGDVQVSSGTGDVTVSDTRSQNVRATTSAGDVRLSFLQAPRSVSVRTSVGDVRVQVPTDQNTYLIKTDTGAGDTHVDDRLLNGRSDRVIDVHTGAGDVNVTGR
jgi:hypothetical protein